MNLNRPEFVNLFRSQDNSEREVYQQLPLYLLFQNLDTFQLKMYDAYGLTIHMLLIVSKSAPPSAEAPHSSHSGKIFAQLAMREAVQALQKKLPCLHSVNCLHHTRSDSTAHRMQPVRQDSHTGLADMHVQIISFFFTLLWFTNTVGVSLQSVTVMWLCDFMATS